MVTTEKKLVSNCMGGVCEYKKRFGPYVKVLYQFELKGFK